MLKLLVPLIIVLALTSGGFFLYKNLQKTPVYQPTPSSEITATSTPPIQSPAASPVAKSGPCEVLTKGSEDVPPLYPGVIWGEAIISKEGIIEYDKDYNQFTISLTGCLIKAAGVISELSDKFDDAYYSKFQRDGWTLVNDSAGPDGSITTHKKQNKYLLIEKRVDSKASSSNNVKYNLKLFYSQ